MEFPITKKAQELLEENKLTMNVLKGKEPINGLKFTLSDIQAIIDEREKEKFLVSISETNVLREEEVKPNFIDRQVAKNPYKDSSPILDFYWKDRSEADKLVATGEYIISEVKSVPGARYGVHKIIILKKV